ncbi:MAG TPA: hypothetical protein VJ777_10915 [Mycobacterium sp.]|nr:hypothetical protein [Mycobacterium sp.]
MSLRDDAFDIGALNRADLPYAAYYPKVRVTARLTVVADLPVEWGATAVPARETGGSYVRPVRKGRRVTVRTCVDVPAVYACHTVRGRQRIPTTVEVGGAIEVGHRLRIVDPLPGVIREEDELLALIAAEL